MQYHNLLYNMPKSVQAKGQKFLNVDINTPGWEGSADFNYIGGTSVSAL